MQAPRGQHCTQATCVVLPSGVPCGHAYTHTSIAPPRLPTLATHRRPPSLCPLRTFKLPEELDQWAAWLSAQPGRDTGLWMLKNNKQRGTGLKLVRTKDAFAAAFETVTNPELPAVSGDHVAGREGVSWRLAFKLS